MNKVGLGLSTALLVTLTGCVAYTDRPSEGSLYMVPTVETAVVVQDDYVYYPGYQIYYSSLSGWSQLGFAARTARGFDQPAASFAFRANGFS